MKIFTAKHEVANYRDSVPSIVPSVIFRTRVRDESIGGDNPYRWQDVSTWDLFGGKKVLVFSLPGAFTPTCSTFQLPDFEKMAPDFYAKGFDEIYCVSVNDSFVMNKWAKENKLEYIGVIPDGSGHFTEAMNMLVDKDNLGFGYRSWRCAFTAENGTITNMFIEAGKEDNSPYDPYEYTSPQFILANV